MNLSITRKSLLLFLITISFLACGGGGGDSTATTQDNTIYTGSFIDSTVEGLAYKTTTQSGFTNTNGAFKYLQGESVSFYLGNIKLGESIGQSVISPVNILSNTSINSQSVINMAIILQSFDSDNNASNGITLLDAARNLDVNRSIDFSNSSDISFLIDDVNSSTGTILLITSVDAQLHLMESLNTPIELLNNSTFTTNENQAFSIDLSTNYDASNDVNFTIKAYDYQDFEIDTQTGIINFLSPPDYESKANYKVTAVAQYQDKIVEKTIQINIININDNTPSLEEIPNIHIKQNTSASIPLSVYDADFDKLSLSVISSNVEVNATTTNSSLSLIPNANWSGDSNITVTVSDGNNTSNRSFLVTVNNDDIAPTVLNKIPNYHVNINSSIINIDITNTFTDVDNDDSLIIKTLVSNNNPTLLDANVTNNNLRLTFKNQEGNATISIKASSNNKSIETSFKVFVSNTDQAPSILKNIEDISIEKGSSNTYIDLEEIFTDVDNDDTDINVTLSVNTNSNIVSASILNKILSLDYSTINVGESNITIQALSNSKTISETFKVTVFESINDSDGDSIPDNIEDLIGLDKSIDDSTDIRRDILDPYFKYQWHIKSEGTLVNNSGVSTIYGNNINLDNVYKKYMGYNNGKPIVVQICDTGVDAAHEDLVDNMNLALSRNSATAIMGQVSDAGVHGTMCAGIIGARAFNNKGLRGVAPFVQIAGSNWLNYQSVSELEEVWTKNDPNGEIALVSNSWGTESASPYLIYEELMQYASENLRIINGTPKGKLFFKAAGNGRNNFHDSGLSYASSNKYVITVAALANTNTYAAYSSSGSNILVSGYSGHYASNSPTIATTITSGQAGTSTWSEDTNQSYTFAMNGTSAATPMVAGAIALVLEACPNLTWRDVRYLIAKNSDIVDSSNSTWTLNSAGLRHSIDYGFGLINPDKIINECRNSSYSSLPASTTSIENINNINIPIPDNNINGIKYQFNIASNKTIEWIGITLISDHNYGADLEIYLTSPAGTKTRLMMGQNSGGNYSLNQGFRYGSVAYMGENSSGTWTIDIADLWAVDEGTLNNIIFETFGH